MEEISLRPVKKDDCKLIWEWRNDAATRKNSLKSEYVPYTEHKKWFKDSLLDRNRKILIVIKNRKPVGVVRFDRLSETESEIDINIAPEHRGIGIGKQALLKSCSYIFKMQDIKKIIANIKMENKKSIKAFTNAGFITEEKGKIIRMCLMRNEKSQV